MKVLIINKFLFPNGGSETYIFKLGENLLKLGHEVQYFGMEHEGRCVGNAVNSYTSDMNFHSNSFFTKVSYSLRTIYSEEARKKIRKVLDDFEPDVCHINNFNYQLTPSIILEIVKWRKKAKKECKIIYTAHDYQLVCPNHMCYISKTRMNCEQCLSGRYISCVNNKCIHDSFMKSFIGYIEAKLWNSTKIYKHIDKIICCSEFMKSKMDINPLFANKTVTLHNFVDKVQCVHSEKKPYILYFGRYSEEKGIGTLIQVCEMLKDKQFIFAGNGPLENQINQVKNIKNVGFKSGDDLWTLIKEASFSIYPSEWYENCPFSVMESQQLMTPVLGAEIGGIPELIRQGETGELFEPGNVDDLKIKIEKMFDTPGLLQRYSENCKSNNFDTVEEYCLKLLKIYQGHI